MGCQKTRRKQKRCLVQKGGLTAEERNSWRLRLRLLLARSLVRSAYSGARFVGIEDPDSFMIRLMTEGAMNAASDARTAAAAGGRLLSQLLSSGSFISNETWIRMVYSLGQLGGVGTSAMRGIIDNTPAVLRGMDNTAGMAVLSLILYAWISGLTGNEIVSIVERGIRGGESGAAEASSSSRAWAGAFSSAVGRLAQGSAERGRAIVRFAGIVVGSISTDVCGPAAGAPLALAMSAAPHVATAETVMGRIEDSIIRLVERVENWGDGGEVAVQLVTAMVQVLSTGDIGSLFRASERAFRLIVSSMTSGASALRDALGRCRDRSRGAAASAASSCAGIPGVFAQFVRDSWTGFRARIDAEAGQLDLASRLRRDMVEARERDDALRARDQAYWEAVLARMDGEQRDAMEALHEVVAGMGVLQGAADLAAAGDRDELAELRAMIDAQIGNPGQDNAVVRGARQAPRCHRPGPGEGTPGSEPASQGSLAEFGSMDPYDRGLDAVAGMQHALDVEEFGARRAAEDIRLAQEHAEQIGMEAAQEGRDGAALSSPAAASPPIPPAYLGLAPHRVVGNKRPREEEDDEGKEGKKKKDKEGGTRRGRKTRTKRRTRRRGQTRRRRRNRGKTRR